jgi:hypothetical protein
MDKQVKSLTPRYDYKNTVIGDITFTSGSYLPASKIIKACNKAIEYYDNHRIHGKNGNFTDKLFHDYESSAFLIKDIAEIAQAEAIAHLKNDADVFISATDWQYIKHFY